MLLKFSALGVLLVLSLDFVQSAAVNPDSSPDGSPVAKIGKVEQYPIKNKDGTEATNAANSYSSVRHTEVEHESSPGRRARITQKVTYEESTITEFENLDMGALENLVQQLGNQVTDLDANVEKSKKNIEEEEKESFRQRKSSPGVFLQPDHKMPEDFVLRHDMAKDELLRLRTERKNLKDATQLAEERLEVLKMERDQKIRANEKALTILTDEKLYCTRDQSPKVVAQNLRDMMRNADNEDGAAEPSFEDYSEAIASVFQEVRCSDPDKVPDTLSGVQARQERLEKTENSLKAADAKNEANKQNLDLIGQTIDNLQKRLKEVEKDNNAAEGAKEGNKANILAQEAEKLKTAGKLESIRADPDKYMQRLKVNRRASEEALLNAFVDQHVDEYENPEWKNKKDEVEKKLRDIKQLIKDSVVHLKDISETIKISERQRLKHNEMIKNVDVNRDDAVGRGIESLKLITQLQHGAIKIQEEQAETTSEQEEVAKLLDLFMKYYKKGAKIAVEHASNAYPDGTSDKLLRQKANELVIQLERLSQDFQAQFKVSEKGVDFQGHFYTKAATKKGKNSRKAKANRRSRRRQNRRAKNKRRQVKRFKH